MFAVSLAPLLAVALSLAEVQRLPDEAYDGRVLDLTGRVYCLAGQQNFVLEDDAARVLVWGYSSNDVERLTPGSRITTRVRAIVNDNGKNCLWSRGITVLAPGDGAVAVERSVRAANVLDGLHDLAFVSLDGILTDVHEDEIEAGNQILTLWSDGETIPVYAALSESLRARRGRLLGLPLRVTGLVMPRSGGWRIFQGRIISVCAPVGDVELLQSAAVSPFDAPRLETIHHLDPREIAALPQLSAAGRVVARGSGGTFLVQFRWRRRWTKSLVATLAEGEAPPSVGQDVRLVGIPETDLFSINLRGVRWRGEPLDEDLPTNDCVAVSAAALFSDAQGRPRIHANLHGRLVSLEGTVRSLPTIHADALHLESDGYDIAVDAGALGPARDDLTLGCRVSVTGFCVLETDVWSPRRPFPQVRGLSILPRTAADVVVVAQPPWWTPRRCLIVIGSLLALVSFGLIWILALKREVARRSRQLHKEGLSRACAELRVEERTRLAVELHDALSQTLTGVAFQIDAAELARRKDPARIGGFLAVARQTLTTCREELRNCLWDLRNRALDETDTEEAIRLMVAPHRGEAEVAINVDVPRARMSDTTFHAVLRIIRELVVNALRHGAARHLSVRGERNGERLVFSVADDGCGFDPASRPSVAEGHFGLHGVAERLDRLGGRLTVRSAPGKGTEISFELPGKGGARGSGQEQER